MTAPTTMSGASVPAADRPLTAGDVPLLREGDVLRVVVAAARNEEWDGVKQPAIGEEVVFIKPSGSGGVSNCIVTSFDPTFGYRPGRFTFVRRPAASDEGVGVRPGGWLIREADGGWLWTGHRIAATAAMTEGHEVVSLAAIAPPPVSERERELEGALRLASDLHAAYEQLIYGLPKYLESQNLTDEENMIREAYITLDVTAHRLAALTAQPAGEPTHG